ncbi:MAG TPA: histidinol-phosphate transaminase [Rhodospirillaceae bacterium]|nr:histidinol-phosphate transaminase [Rhodospirillaceae bacterium]MBL25321.1 histidinol-phosphate transaminase [Rhodospirillaceae bacterium]HAA91352.1 histidinol-phosphate transaminase [Rhodospirillaceae bacterium]HAT34179.1 histidinol-phosphate transaminase [Rhodospirillaceae bacterium]
MSSPIPRPGVLDVAPYVGGLHSVDGVERVIVLASNETPLGASPNAIKAFRDTADDMHRYCDGHALQLREAIGRRFGCDPARIVCGAGSDELIQMLIRAYAGPGDEMLYSKHGFSIYPIFATGAGVTAVAADETNLTADSEALLDRVTESTRLVFLANPNNPTGTYLGADQLTNLRENLREDILLVIDAAYAEYVNRNDYTAGIDLVERYGNVVMTRTCSKIFGLAALRLGWAYCPPAIADVLNRVRSPFNVNGPAQAAGLAAMEDRAHTDKALSHNEEWLPWLSTRLAGLGLDIVPSAANFVLARFEDAGAAEHSYNALLRRGIITRLMKSYHLPDCLRISIGLGEENEAVATALEQIFEGSAKQ